MSDQPISLKRSYYFGAGTRRHIAKKREGNYVWLWCGMSGFPPKLLAVRIDPSCRHCIRALTRFTDHKGTTDYHEGQHEADDTSNRRQDGGSRDSGGEGDGDVPAENPSPPVSELDLRRRARVVAKNLITVSRLSVSGNRTVPPYGSVLFERKGPEEPS